MKLKHFSFVILAFVVTFNSCKSRKKVAETVENVKEAFWENSFEYLEIKADANATLPDGNNQNFNLFIKMKKDSLIWVSARKFGFEGARAIITKDSFFVINRLDRSYMSEPLTKIKNIIGFESDLSQLQNILVGKALFNRNVYEVADDNDSLSGFKGVQGGLINRFFIDEFALLKKSYLSNFANTQNAEITYTEYIDVNKKITPKILDILAYSGGQKLGCTLNYTNISDKKIDNFAFVVPSNYKKL